MIPILFYLQQRQLANMAFQHVNCQEREYWMTKMKNNGYLFNQDLLNEIKSWDRPEDSPFWWPQNLMVFI